MTLVLSSREEREMAAATEVLLDTCADDSSWRSEAMNVLKRLFRAEVAGMLISRENVTSLVSDDLPPDSFDTFAAHFDGFIRQFSIRQRAVRLGVVTRERLFGRRLDEYLQTPYFNELIAANRCFHMIGLAAGSWQHGVQDLQVFRTRRSASKFSQREVQIARLLLPAFRHAVLARLHRPPADVTASPEAQQVIPGLTQAERRVAVLLAQRLSNREIAHACTISPHAARRHTERVLAKLEIKSRRDVARRLKLRAPT